jgi:hypothetical protein
MSNIEENDEISSSQSDKDIQNFGGVVNPFIQYIYEFLQKYIIKRYNLKIRNDFWYFLTFGIFSGILYFTGISWAVPLILISLAGLVFIGDNAPFLRRKVFQSSSEEIDLFFKDIEKKSLYDAINFIINTRFGTKTTIRLLNIQKFNENIQIYEYILKKIAIEGELLDYLIEHNLYAKMGDDLFCEFLKESISPTNYSSYQKLKTEFNRNERVIKTINMIYPSYLKDHRIFKFFAKIPVKIKNFFVYGIGNIVFLAIFFGIYLSLYLKGALNYLIIPSSEQFFQVFEVFSVFISMFLASAILTIIIRFLILSITQKRMLLYYFSPKTFD